MPTPPPPKYAETRDPLWEDCKGVPSARRGGHWGGGAEDPKFVNYKHLANRASLCEDSPGSTIGYLDSRMGRSRESVV